jgi:hypothetical protein
MKMEQTEFSETSAYKLQTPGNYPEENIKEIYYCPSQWSPLLSSREYSGRNVLLNTHLYLVTRLKTAGAIPLVRLRTSVA